MIEPVGPDVTGSKATAVLETLPPVFTYRQARRAGLSHRALYWLRDAGQIAALDHGLFRNADAELTDQNLAEAAARAPRATLCLTSALVHHDLSDAIPPAPHLALPRGTRIPSLSVTIAWHTFDATTFEIGRERLAVDDGLLLGVFTAERTIVDTFRLRHLQGDDEAYEALRRWLRRPDAQPASLLRVAERFPRAVGTIRHALEILL